MSQSAQPSTEDADDGVGGGTSREVVGLPPGRRWTANVNILVIEARLQAEGRRADNPAWPLNPSTKKRAADRIEAEGLDVTPIWTDLADYPGLTADGVVHEMVGGDDDDE